jgi:hypothetical protein
MSDSILVRASRDGDQFHYLWAARRALQLLTSHSKLVAITIEGVSTTELQAAGAVEAGEELIDIAEYYDSTAIDTASLVRYIQLKHSTLRADEPWQPSGLQKTITGFAERFKALQQRLTGVPLHEKLELCFVTNRPINVDVLEAVEDAAAQRAPRHSAVLAKLKKYTSLDDAELSIFCRMLRLEGRQDDYWNQRNILSQDVSGYLPQLDVDAPMRLKELVTRKALSESVTNPSITKMDVLRALQTDETQLFPAPCLIESLHDAIPREQEATLVQAIVGAVGRPVVIHADAGVGKSILSTRIGLGLPPGSVSILYDCFGNGQYRSASGCRHRHHTALVQIANELSALGLCHPLIPTVHADVSAYMRAFIHRLKQSISVLKAQSGSSMLCLVVDAADNAQMAAEEVGERHSFVRDLLREQLPEGVRLVALCRPHRVALLNPSPETLQLNLEAFTREETAAHLRQSFPESSERDVDEFHRLSSHNPRVQALALSRKASLPEILRLLGPNPTTVESAIGSILEKSIARLRDTAVGVESGQVDLICAGLAALRPLIPISVLASMSKVDEAAIKSFALDLGRPLIVTGATIQFFDEPAESWFREQFRPNAAGIEEFVARLKPLASGSPYVASVLPQLMLEAGQFSELVELALASKALPETNPVERRDVELQRLQFALKAGLRSQRYSDAAKLALKAGGESAGHDRQRRLLQDNTDVAGVFMESSQVQEVVSRRTFGSGWVGSHNVYEAAILSGHSELIGDARSRLRMADEWLRNWSKLTPKEREEERVTDEDRAVMALAHLNIHGAKAAAKSLRAWRPRELSYRAGRVLARRLLDHGRYNDLDDLATAAGNDIGLVCAIAVEVRRLNRLLPKRPAECGFKLLAHRRVLIDDPQGHDELALTAVTALVEIAYLHGICDAIGGMKLLERYLPKIPPYGLASRHSGLCAQYLRAYALRAALTEKPLQLAELATAELRKEIEAEKQYNESRSLREFKRDVGALIPWYNLWARAIIAQVAPAELANAIADARAASSKAEGGQYGDVPSTSDEIAAIWMDILFQTGGADGASIRTLIEWSRSLKRQLFTPTLNRLAGLCAQVSGAEGIAFEFAQTAFSLLRDERADAQSKAEGYVEIARSLLTISRSDSEAYFNHAVEVASKLGDENLARWDAMIDLAERAARGDRPAAEVAYNFARCAEVTRAYVDRDKHFAWDATVRALAGLCPASSLAIMSRWRDRRFGSTDRILAPTIEALIALGKLSPLDALPLVWFRADLDEDKLLETLPSCRQKEKTAALDLIYRYTQLRGDSVNKLRRLEATSAAAGVELVGLKALIAAREADESASESPPGTEWDNLTSRSANEDRNWDEVFLGCDLTAPDGISVAFGRFLAGPPPFYRSAFFSQAIYRVPIGKEAEFVRAFRDVAAFDLYDIRSFLEALPREWSERLGIRSALATMVRDLCRRFCMVITRNREYEVMPLELASQVSGVAQVELVDAILAGIGESTELAEAQRLFSLVGLLSIKLTSDEALAVLSYGLSLFDPVLEDTDGDGPWSTQLMPPAAVEDALAGYIWAALASPVATTRWEAAHVVVALCALGRSSVLAGLFGHAVVGTTTPFGDLRLLFYGFHAQQWLLIAAARAALEHGDALVPHANYFLSQGSVTQPHVLIRLFAARTALTLAEQRKITLQDDDRQRLAAINSSPFASVGVDRSECYKNRNLAAMSKEELPENDRYFFGMDFGQYWLQPLGECFGLSQSEVELEALKTIRDDLGCRNSRSRDNDERAQRGLYPHEGTYYSYSSYPRADDQGFYLSYHAMLITAGRLLAMQPLVEGSDEWDRNRFPDWIRRHDISRTDGRWLADRRDPQPPGMAFTRLEGDNNNEWLGSIAIDGFKQTLFLAPDYMTVWGSWSRLGTNRQESFSIRSSLVSTERSASLLAALQTADDPHAYRIPDEDDDLQIDMGPFQLKGWIADRSGEGGVDDNDPWAGNVRFPAPEPAAFVTERMGLSTDADRRLWRTPSDHLPTLRSEVWGSFSERDSSEQPNGSRLWASRRFVHQFLAAIGMDMLVEVEIQRRSRHQPYETPDENEPQNIPASTRIFIIKGDGTICSL